VTAVSGETGKGKRRKAREREREREGGREGGREAEGAIINAGRVVKLRALEAIATFHVDGQI
jgi:hypothetical protein